MDEIVNTIYIISGSFAGGDEEIEMQRCCNEIGRPEMEKKDVKYCTL